MRVLLVNPSPIHHPPLGLGYLSAYLKARLGAAVETRLLDDTDERSVARAVLDFAPDLVAATVMTVAFPHLRGVCAQIKQLTSAPIVLGGPHVTAAPECLLQCDADVGVIGEGEETFRELVECYRATRTLRDPRIAGIAFVEGPAVVQTAPRALIEDLDTIPAPDRDLFDMARYTRPQGIAHGLYAKATSLMPSRGCPLGQCDFCSSQLTWGRSPRFFSPRRVARELADVVGRYGLNFVIFLDDNFTTRRPWLAELGTLLKGEGLDRLGFDCESLSTTMSDEKAALLKEMGCVRVEFGFESGAPRVLERLKAGKVRVEDNSRAVEICRRHGLAILGNVIFGHMDETAGEMEESAAWFGAQQLEFVAPHVYTPYPGTSGWQECVRRGLIDPRQVQWERMQTYRDGRNPLVNAHVPEGEFWRRYAELSAELTRHNQVIVVERGLSPTERTRLFAEVVRRGEGSVFRRPDGSSLATTVAAMRPLVRARDAGGRLLQAARGLRQHGVRGLAWAARNRIAPRRALTCRLPFGARFRAWNDQMGRNLYLRTRFEEGELRLVARLLGGGMTVLDVGAHQGLYSLLAAGAVGPDGLVVAFEPSPRERERLLANLALNRCANVRVETSAVGGEEGQATLHVCLGRETGCNSLRPPSVDEPTAPVPVPLTTLDGYLARTGIARVDLVKLDVEGAELDAIAGARLLLTRPPRPVVLCELADARTRAWGYAAREVYDAMQGHGFSWFSITADGSLRPCPRRVYFHENLLAVPAERLDEAGALLEQE